MYFVSKNPRLQLVVQADVTEYIHQTNGQTREKTISPVVYAEFAGERALPNEYRVFAVEYFNNPARRGTEWHPAGITGLGDPNEGTLGGQYYEGTDPKFRLGILDTDNESHVAAEYKELVEQYLLNSVLLGNDYIKFDTKLPKPWPSFEKIPATQEGVKKMLERVEDDELDPQYIIDYENAKEKPRQTVIRALEEYIASKAAAV